MKVHITPKTGFDFRVAPLLKGSAYQVLSLPYGLQFRVFLLLDWLPSKVIAHSLMYYLTHRWEKIYALFNGMIARWTKKIQTEFELSTPTLISKTQSPTNISCFGIVFNKYAHKQFPSGFPMKKDIWFNAAESNIKLEWISLTIGSKYANKRITKRIQIFW